MRAGNTAGRRSVSRGRQWKLDVNELSPQTQKFIMINQERAKAKPEEFIWEDKIYRSIRRRSSCMESSIISPKLKPKSSNQKNQSTFSSPVRRQFTFLQTQNIIPSQSIRPPTYQDEIEEKEAHNFVNSLPKNSGCFSGRDPYGTARRRAPETTFYHITPNDKSLEINDKLKEKILNEESRKELAIQPILSAAENKKKQIGHAFTARDYLRLIFVDSSDNNNNQDKTENPIESSPKPLSQQAPRCTILKISSDLPESEVCY